MTWILSQAAVTGSVAVATWNANGTKPSVEADNGDLYIVYIDNTSTDVVFRKSTDGGLSWSSATTVITTTATNVSVWFDSWSGQTGGLIHIACIESATDDVHYRCIQTESADALTTQTTIGAGGTTAIGGALSIARSRGGNVYCQWSIDAGAEEGFSRLLNADVPNGAWAARTNGAEGATTDQWILLPSYNADNNDMMMFYWDASADEISRKLYDDSGNSWAETSIAGTMPDIATNMQWAACPDLANSRNWLIAWTAVDTLNADLLAWNITEGAVNAVTDVITNQTDDQGLCGLSIKPATGAIHAFYGGQTGGAEVYSAQMNIYRKISTDSGATWGTEEQVTPMSLNLNINFQTTLAFVDTPVLEIFPPSPLLGFATCVDYTPPAGGGVATPLFGGGVV
jgi:hypothetical protein